MEKFLSLLQPYEVDVTQIILRVVMYHLEALLNKDFYEDFESCNCKKNGSRKVLRHIPIIPCLQQLFRCESITQFMDYHAWNRSGDVVLRMHAYVYAFSYIEEKWSIFKEEPCNVRL